MPWLLVILRFLLHWLLGPWGERVVLLARADGRVEQGGWNVWRESFRLDEGHLGRADKRGGEGLGGGAARWRSAVRWGPAAPPGRDEPPPR
jgi:hypothetical protein